MISPMLPKLCVAVGCPEQGNHCLRLQIKLLICTAHVYFGKVAGTRLLNLILTLDFYELGVLRNRYSYALQGCQQYSLNTTLRPNYCTGVVISTVRCSGELPKKKPGFFWEISPKSVYPPTHPWVFVRFGSTKGEFSFVQKL